MSKLSKSGIEATLGIASADELNDALAILRNKDAQLDLYMPEDELPAEEEMTIEQMKALVAEVRKERNEVKQVSNIQARQKRLEELSRMSTKYFEDVMDKAFNAEDRYAPDLLNAASNLLKVATDAETTLINSDTKMADLQLKKEKQDLDANKQQIGETKSINGENITIIDRNSLLKELRDNK